MSQSLGTLEKFADTARQLAGVKKSSEFYEIVFDLAKEVFDCGQCAVLLKEANSNILKVVAARGNWTILDVGQRIHPGEDVKGRALSIGKTQLAASTISGDTIEIGDRDDNCEAAIPLTGDDGHVQGIFVIGGRRGACTDSLVPILSLFGELISSSMARLRLQRDVAERARRMAAVSKAVQLVSSDKPFRSVLDDICELTMRTLNPDGCSIQLCSEDRSCLIVEAARGHREDISGMRVPRDCGVPGLAMATRRPSLAPNMADSKAPNHTPITSDYLSELAVPLVYRDQVLGVLHLGHRQPGMFDEGDLLNATVLADCVANSVGVENVMKDAQGEVSYVDEQLALLVSTVRGMTRYESFEEIFTEVFPETAAFLRLARAAVLIPTLGLTQLEVKYLFGYSPEVVGKKVSLESSLPGEAYRRAETVFTTEGASQAACLIGEDALDVQVASPLKNTEQVLGVLVVESDRQLVQGDISVLETITEHLSTALEKELLKAHLNRNSEKLGAVNRGIEALNADLPLVQVLENVLALAQMGLALAHASLFLCGDDGETFSEIVSVGHPRDIEVTHQITVSGDVLASAIRHKTIQFIGDAAPTDGSPEQSDGMSAEVAVPLIVKGNAIGVLVARSSKQEGFDDDDLTLLTTFSNQAAQAVHRERLFGRLADANRSLEQNVAEMSKLNEELGAQATKIFRINEDLETQIRNLTTIHEAGKAITSSLDLDATLNTILKMTSEIVNSTAAAIKLLDDETRELKIRARSGMPPSISSGSSVYEIPLEIGDKRIGVFELVCRSDEIVGKEEQRMIETLASQAAIAIENARLFKNTQQIYYDTLRSLACALEARDDYTRGHSERVAKIARRIAEEMKLDETTTEALYNAALLHDIGKIGIRDEVLLAPRKLTTREMDIIKEHSVFGNTILMPLKFLGQIRECVRHHHERWDGTGYPDQRKGEEIPLPSRIIAVADAFDAMTSDRPYRQSISQLDAIAEIKTLAGKQFDPDVVKAFLRVSERFHG